MDEFGRREQILRSFLTAVTTNDAGHINVTITNALRLDEQRYTELTVVPFSEPP